MLAAFRFAAKMNSRSDNSSELVTKPLLSGDVDVIMVV